MERHAVDGAPSSAQNHVTGPAGRSRENLLPHNSVIIWIMKIIIVLLLLFYFIIPAIIWIFPGIIVSFTYLNQYRWPLYPNFSLASDYGIKYTRNFFIKSENNVALGSWHILPQKLGQSLEPGEITDKQFLDSLDDGLPIFLYMHGNAGNRAGGHRVELYKVLAEAGCHVIAFDYRGFGDSPGSPSESGLVEDSLKVFHWIKEHSGDSPVFLWGHSLGSGVATQAAAKLSLEGANFSGLVLESPFNNYLEAALSFPLTRTFQFMPWFSWIFVDCIKHNQIEFASDQHIEHVTKPILILHAEDDDTIPFALGLKLYNAAKYGPYGENVDFVRYSGSHNYGHIHIYRAPDLVDSVKNFVSSRKK